MKNLILFLTFIIIHLSSLSQKELTLYNMKGIPQALNVNPSFIPQSRFHLYIPFLNNSFGLTNSAFALNNVSTRLTDNSLFYSMENFKNKSNKNVLAIDNRINVLGFGVKLKNMYINFDVNLKSQIDFAYPKELIKLFVEGNGGENLGKRISLDGLALNSNLYNEFGFGFSKEFLNKINLGGKLKLISGISNINMKRSQLGLYTNPENFALTMDGDAEIETSNSGIFLNPDFSDYEKETVFRDLLLSPINFKNKGIGIDFGTNFKITKRISVNASIIDLGFINWKSNTYNFKLNEFNYTYEGTNLKQYLSNDTSEYRIMDNLNDSIKKAFSIETNNKSYSTSLPTRIYIGGSIHFTKSLYSSLVILNSFFKGIYTPSVSVSFNMKIRNMLYASVNYSIINKTYTNLGMGISMNGGPIQFYLISDNILGFLNPVKARTFNIALGTSINLKSKENKSEPIIDILK